MAIDRIAKPGAPVPVTPDAPSASAEASRPFAPAVAGPDAPHAEAPHAEAPSAPTALQQLRSGTISAATYLDLKVNEATSHLASLPASQLEAIRAELRERMSSDPMFVDLVRTAAGDAAPAPRRHD
jgi:hypothetical protein